MDLINTKKLVPDAATHVRLMFEMYARPEISLGDVARHFSELGIQLFSSELQRVTISKLLCNPVYVQVDMDVYEFFKSSLPNLLLVRFHHSGCFVLVSFWMIGEYQHGKQTRGY